MGEGGAVHVLDRDGGAVFGVVCAHTIHRRGFVLDLGVDLAGRHVGVVTVHQIAQGALLLTEGRQHVHGREHSGVRVVEVLEVVVGGVLTTEHGLLGGHHGLNERVPHTGAHGAATVGLHELRHSLGGDQVVDHHGLLVAPGAGPGDLAFGHDGGNGRRRDGLAALVHHCRSTRFAGSSGLAG